MKIFKALLRVFVLLLSFFRLTCGFAQRSEIGLKGIVVDKEQSPIEFASVRIPDLNLAQQTKADGSFSFTLKEHDLQGFTITIDYLNKKQVLLKGDTLDLSKPLIVTLLDESLTLDDVTVSAVRKSENSVSSIIFDQEAIRQTQAFSLIDVLNNLPGRKNTEPNLQSPETITFRTNATNADATNNSFGIAIFIDGVRVNKDGNMQARGVSNRGMGNASINAQGRGSYDVTYNGFDLRDFPVENIERIEVIQGVANAKFDEMTSGAILITTKAGRSPLNLNLNTNGGSINFSASKGLSLGRKAGALNVNADYLYSNSNPIDRIKSYGRINAGATWSVNITDNILNNFKIGFDKRIDDVKQDPDDDAERMAFAKSHNFTMSNRLSINFKRKVINNINASISYASGFQNTYSQWIINTLPRAIADKDTNGIYEGYFVPGNYMAVEQIQGKPISLQADIDMQLKEFFTGSFRHKISLGFNVSATGNLGKGLIIDPDRPRFSNLMGQNLRSFNYADSVKLTTNWGNYIQNSVSGKIWKKTFQLNLGLRQNLRNSISSWQPRLSMSYAIFKDLSLTGAYGIATKSPSLAHLYPGPTFYDISLLNLYTGFAANSLYLVYTNKILNNNTFLKSSLTQQGELGAQYRPSWGSISVHGFQKTNKNGFSSQEKIDSVIVPIYGYVLNADDKIEYFDTHNTRLFAARRNIITNKLSSNDKGLELMLQTKDVKPISTNFSARAAYYVSKYNNNITMLTIEETQDDGSVILRNARFEFINSGSLVAGMSANKQIPAIGFIVSLSTDVTLFSNNHYHPIDSITNKVLSHEVYTVKQPKLYALWNLTLAKEIKKKIRLNIKAYNFFNQRPYTIIDNKQQTVKYIGKSIGVTAGINIKI